MVFLKTIRNTRDYINFEPYPLDTRTLAPRTILEKSMNYKPP